MREAMTDGGRLGPVIVFLGPTLSRADAANILAAEYRPPARRGDVHRALRDRCRTIVLIDGEFHGHPSVWQREILDAIAEGTEVHGASSMGALRAAELHSFGMVGHGRIFDWYRDGVIEADDEVALVYGPPERGYLPRSEPLVNIRATLTAAVPCVISADERDRLIEDASNLYYPERSWARLLDTGPAVDWSADRRADLATFVSQSYIDQKRRDAIEALRTVAAASLPRRDRPATRVPVNPLWRRERCVSEGFAPSVSAIDPAGIAQQAGITSQELHDLWRELSELFFVGAWAHDHGIRAEASDVAVVRRQFAPSESLAHGRIERLLATRATAHAAVRTFLADGGARDSRTARRAMILDWADTNGVRHGELHGDALVDWIIAEGPNHFGFLWHFGVELIDDLRLRGYGRPLQTGAVS
jgi:hypothetical protein